MGLPHLSSENTTTPGSVLALAVRAVPVGIAAGAVVGAFRLLHDLSGARITAWLHLGMPYWWSAPLWLGCALALACATGLLVRRFPLISGSGIPDVEAFLAGRLPMPWKRILLPKFVGSMFALWGGLSLGREGPCIQMAAAVGRALGLGWNDVAPRNNHAVIGGAAAGLTAAFGAPLAGIVFVFEEMRCPFSFPMFVTATLASTCAWATLRYGFGLGQILPFDTFLAPDLRDAQQLLLVAAFGMIMGIMGAIYNTMLIAMKQRYDRQTLTPDWLKPVWPFLAGVGLFYTLPAVLGGGDTLIVSLAHMPFSFRMLLLLTAVKLLFSHFSFACGVPGGLLMPILCIGALMGAIFGQAAAALGVLPPPDINSFLVYGMAAYFAATVRAPFTGIALCAEMSGSAACLPGMLLAGLVAHVTANLLHSEPVYVTLRAMLLRGRAEARE